MTATIFNTPGLGWADSSGNPLSGGKVYIYQAGTVDTVKTSYPTRDDAAAMTNANAHPVVLDAAGRPATDIWVEGTYKAVVTDASDVTIASVDNLGGADADDLIPRDYIGGLAVTISGGDAQHDFTIAIGEARDDADTDDMVLPSALTKQIDATWVAGTNAGALDTGTVEASTDYYIYLIKSTGTSAVDVLLSKSATAPTMPSGYDKKQIIGRLVTDASSNISAVYGRDRTIAGVAFSKGTADGKGIAGSGANTDISSLAALTSINGHGQWGFRNLLRNGAMRVAQRGTSTSSVSTGYGPCDGWALARASGGSSAAAFTVSQQTGGPAPFDNFVRCLITTAQSSVGASDHLAIQQRIEAQDLQHLKYGDAGAKSVTIQFRIRVHADGASSLTFPLTLGAALYQPDGSRSHVQEVTVSAADTWETKTLTFPGDVSGTINNDNGEGLRLALTLFGGANAQATAGAWAAGEDYTTSNQANLCDATNNYIDLTGAQAEVGSIATDFEHVPYGAEMQRCQRYYWRYFPGVTSHTVGVAQAFTTADAALTMKHPVPMRAAPTIVDSSISHFMFTNGAGNSSTVDAFTYESNIHSFTGFWSSSATPFTVDTAIRIRTDSTNGASAWLDATAEL